MKSIQHFELDQHTASRHRADTDCLIRAISGRVWLTVEGQPHDVWLVADTEHAATKGSIVWLSAEPLARIAIAARHECANGKTRWAGRWSWLLPRGSWHREDRTAAPEKWLTA